MKISMNAKKIVKKVKEDKSDREKITLYLSRAKYDEFKDVCAEEDVPTSKVLEALIHGFLESIGKK